MTNFDEKLIKKIETPFYTFDIDILHQRIAYLQSLLPKNVRLCYAMKANPFVVEKISDVIKKYEICSYGEYKIAEELGIDYSNMVISGVYKDKESMEYIIKNYKHGEVITIESLNQIKLVDDITKRKKVVVDVILRLTSGNQFGMTEEEIEKILESRFNYNFLNIMGIQYFSGTQKQIIKRLEKEINYLDNFVDHLRNDFGYIVEELEFGPGFPVVYFECDKEFNEDEYLKDVFNLLSNMKYQGRITVELGRSIVACSGNYYTKVVDVKTNKEGNFAILDGGMNHLVYYGQMMAMKKPKLEIISSAKNSDTEEWNLCGSLCTINDLIVKKLSTKQLKIGDVFIFKNTGAYSMTEGISLFLSRDLPKVVFVQNGNYEIVRKNFKTYKLNMPIKGGDING